jgi:hypothetical protein
MTSGAAYRHRHLIRRDDPAAIEAELDQLSAEGWEVVQFAVATPAPGEREYVYLLRRRQ